MKVTIERLKSLSSRDKLELNRLYLDYPVDIQAEGDPEHPQNRSWVLSPNESFFAARFHNHIIGAVLVRQHPKAWEFDYICVLTKARGRGIAQQLIEVMRKAAEAKNFRLEATVIDNSPILLHILHKAGLAPNTTSHNKN